MAHVGENHLKFFVAVLTREPHALHALINCHG
jgi:hypothetical protein